MSKIKVAYFLRDTVYNARRVLGSGGRHSSAWIKSCYQYSQKLKSDPQGNVENSGKNDELNKNQKQQNW